MKLNLKELKIYNGISKTNYETVDVREQFADIIYKGGGGIAALELARKIYGSDENTEYTDDEIVIMRRHANLCTPQFIDAIETEINKEE